VSRLTAFFRSIRFRLALTFSLVVFGMAFLVVAGVNYALGQSLKDVEMAQRLELTTFFDPLGNQIIVAEQIEGRLVTVEQLANERALETLRRYSVIAMVGLFPLSIAAGWVIADRTLRPIGRITAVAKEIQAGDLSERIDLGGPDDELRELADIFDAMLERLEDGAEGQRRFIQDTSHELRNPLAVMATNLDVVLSDPGADVDTFRKTAEVVRRTVDRAAQTVDDLVVFARRDIPASVRTPVSLRTMAAEVVADYMGPMGERRVDIEYVGEDAVVDVDVEGLKRALGNLVNNAVRLTREGSTIEIGTGRRDGFAWVGVADQGPGIDVRDHEAVFQRGWSGDGSSIGTETRNGLGLAIARQIANAHAGELTLRSVRGAGASFVIWLPVAAGADHTAITEDGVHPLHDPFAEG